MSKSKHPLRSLFPASAQPPRRMGRSLLYIAFGGVVFICAVCLLGTWMVAPHWSSPQQLLAFGSKGTGPGMLEKPTYIDLDGQGNIYVAALLRESIAVRVVPAIVREASGLQI